jgi:hypothetical protein
MNQIISKKPGRWNKVTVLMFLQLDAFRAFSPIIRSIKPCITARGVLHTVHTDHAAISWVAAQQHNNNWVQNATCCNTRSNAPDDGRKRPKHVELKNIKTVTLLHLVGFFY